MGKISFVDPVLFFYMFALYFESMWTPEFVEEAAYRHYNVRPPNETNSSCVSNANASQQNSSSSTQKAEALASDWLLYISLSSNIPAVVLALLVGGFSDRYGRRMLIVVPSIGAATEALLFIVVMATNLPLEYLLIGNTIQGFTGGGTTLFMAVFSYAADVTPTNNRTWRLGVLESMTFIGGCLGQLLGGVCVEHASPYIVVGIAAGCHFFNIFYVGVCLEEAAAASEVVSGEDEHERLHKVQNDSIDEVDVSPRVCSPRKIFSFIDVFVATDNRRPNYPRWLLMTVYAVFGLYTLVVFGIGDVQYLYLTNLPLCWTPSLIGYFSAFRYVTGWFAALILVPVFSKFLHFRDTTVVIIAMLTMAPSLVVEAFATKSWVMFLVPVIGICGGATQPVLRSMMSKLAGKDRQGALFSAVASLETAVTLFGSSIFNPLYGALVQKDVSLFPENGAALCFFIMACILLLPVAIIV